MTSFFSTTTPLAGNAIFTSPSASHPAKDLRGYAFSDKPFTVNILQSADDVNFDFVSAFASTANGANQQCGWVVDRVAKFVRLQIVNGAAAMTTLRAHMGGM